jgi:hypothetical protein
MSKVSGSKRWLASFAVLLTFGCPLAFGQVQTGEILGTVTDATGAANRGQ